MLRRIKREFKGFIKSTDHRPNNHQPTTHQPVTHEHIDPMITYPPTRLYLRDLAKEKYSFSEHKDRQENKKQYFCLFNIYLNIKKSLIKWITIVFLTLLYMQELIILIYVYFLAFKLLLLHSFTNISKLIDFINYQSSYETEDFSCSRPNKIQWSITKYTFRARTLNARINFIRSINNARGTCIFKDSSAQEIIFLEKQTCK